MITTHSASSPKLVFEEPVGRLTLWSSIIAGLICFFPPNCVAQIPEGISSNPSINEVLGWGRNDEGQLGIAMDQDGFMKLAPSWSSYVLGLKKDGSILGWGFSEAVRDSLGVSGGVTRFSTNSYIDVAAGYYHLLGLLPDGKVVSWGSNSQNQAAVPPRLSGVKSIVAGVIHSLALRTNGTVAGWGGITQEEIPTGLTNVIAIAAGGFHNMALKADGTVVCWGSDNQGQSSPPASLSGVKAIAAGWNFSMALLTNNRVVAWGDNSLRQLEVPSFRQGMISAIAAGNWHALGLTTEGEVYGWGDWTFGKTFDPYRSKNVTGIAAGGDISFALLAPLAPPPSNDKFESATIVSGTNISVIGSTGGATYSVDEPDSRTDPQRRPTLWWAWTAPGSENITIDLSGSSGLALSLYSGDRPENLTEQKRVDAPGFLSFASVSGRTYYLAITRSLSVIESDMDFSFNLEVTPLPTNDLRVNATIVEGAQVAARGTTLGATSEPGEPAVQGGASNSVWWKWTSPFSGGAVFEPAGLFTIYEGDLLFPIKIDARLEYPPKQFFRALKGETYWIRGDARVDFDSSIKAGPVSFSLNLSPPPPNDDFSNRVLVIGENPIASGSTAGSTFEEREPRPGSELENAWPEAGSVWWSWQAPARGSLGLYLRRLNGASLLRVYTGDSLTNLQNLLNTPSATSSLAVEGGKTYHFQISANLRMSGIAASPFSRGSVEMELKLYRTPSNSQFASHISLTRPFEKVDGYLGEEPVWHSWTAPSDPREVSVVLELARGNLEIFQGASLTTLVPTPVQNILLPWSNYREVRFQSIPRETYYFRVATFAAELFNRDFQLRISAPALSIRLNPIMALSSGAETLFNGNAVIRNSGAEAAKARLRFIALAEHKMDEECSVGPSGLGALPAPIDAGLIDLGILQPGETVTNTISGTCPAPIIYTGISWAHWRVMALLEQEMNGMWLVQDKQLVVFGQGMIGCVVGGGSVQKTVGFGSDFAPVTVTNVTIHGPSEIFEKTVASYSAVAQFSNGAKVQFTNGFWASTAFDISSNGVLQAGNTSWDTNFTLTASHPSDIDMRGSLWVEVLNRPGPQLTARPHSVDGSQTIEIRGTSGQRFRLLSTEDLRSPIIWAPLFTNTLPARGPIIFNDPEPLDRGSRFYRAEEIP